MTEAFSPNLNALIIRGPYRGTSGYDHHVREFTRELMDRGVDVELQNFNRWSTPGPEKISDNKYFKSLHRAVKANRVLHFVMPPQVDIVKSKININFTMFEADCIPAHWLKHNLQHDLLVLPTVSSKKAWIRGGFPEERIRICPLGVNTKLFMEDVKPLPLRDHRGRPVSEYKTRILNISDLIPRKNLVGLLRVWIQSTSRSDNAILIIKTGTPWRRWLYKFLFDVRCMERRIGKSRKEAAPVLMLINKQYSDLEMRRLYAAATHYCSLSFGEGWDLCMMEAGASGLHLIAPDHSSYPAYLNADMADMIPSIQVPAKFYWAYGLHKMFAGTNWWCPDEGVACEYICQAIKSENQEKQFAAKKHIIKNFSWGKATTRLVENIINI